MALPSKRVDASTELEDAAVGQHRGQQDRGDYLESSPSHRCSDCVDGKRRCWPLPGSYGLIPKDPGSQNAREPFCRQRTKG